MTSAPQGDQSGAGAPNVDKAAPDEFEVRPLHEVLYQPVDPAHVAGAFGDRAPTWMGQPIGPRPDGAISYACDLELRVSPDGRAVFRKSAIVSLGQPRLAGGSWAVPIEWRAATLAPLFPVFVGSLTISADRIALDGHYAPPFGVIGLVLDRALLAIAARATARWFLAKVAIALG